MAKIATFYDHIVDISRQENMFVVDALKLARELGVEKWTLGNILEEATHQKSRFTLWITGHSQGGAVMQVLSLIHI